MESRETKRRFPPPWTIERQAEESFAIKDANGLRLATVYCRDDLQHWSYGQDHLTSDEARRIAQAIARIPEFVMQRRGFNSRAGGHPRWRRERPYHVAFEDSYVRKNWDLIEALCKLNGIVLFATGETIRDAGVWCVYEFASQEEAMMCWDQFQGRWMRGTAFTYPERPDKMPQMKQIKDWNRFQGRNDWR